VDGNVYKLPGVRLRGIKKHMTKVRYKPPDEDLAF